MALPTSRSELKAYVLRNLGAPLIRINVSDDQMDDRIDEALQTWIDYHYDGTTRTYWMYQLTDQDITNRYITTDPNIVGVVKIFPLGTTLYSSYDLFSLQFQMAQSDLLRGGMMGDIDITSFMISKTYIELIDQWFGTTVGVNFNRHTNKIYPEVTWTRLTAGDYLMIEVFTAIDPDEYTAAWSDRWLMKYITQLIKRQWGSNIKKFGDVQLLGGVTINGKEIFDEADKEVHDMEAELISTYSLPPTGFMA